MGEWVEREPSYLSFDVYNCAYCGKMIPRHIWFEETDDQRQAFCNPDCSSRFRLARQRAHTEESTDTSTG